MKKDILVVYRYCYELEEFIFLAHADNEKAAETLVDLWSHRMKQTDDLMEKYGYAIAYGFMNVSDWVSCGSGGAV